MDIQKSGKNNWKCIKEDILTIYKITKNLPEVECFEVTPNSSHEPYVSYITTNEEDELGPKQKNLGERLVGTYPALNHYE